MSAGETRHPIAAVVSNAGCGELMVSLSDLLEWLRVLEDRWEGTTGEPSRVVQHIADGLRDTWLDLKDPRDDDEDGP